jgi:hypothetical protein
MIDALPHIRIKDPIWQPWHVELSPLGGAYAKDAPPSHMLVPTETMARSPFIALEEHFNGDKFAEIAGVRFQVIGFDAGSQLFGLRRVA